MKTIGLLLILGAISLNAQVSIPGHDPEKLQILLLTGYNSTKMHQWKVNSRALQDTLEAAGRFEVRINQEPRGATEETFSGYDVLLLDYSNYIPSLAPTWSEATRQAYLEFLRNGKGVVAYHVTVGSFQEWPGFRKSIGIAEMKHIGHGPYHNFTVEIKDPRHPVTQGLRGVFNQWGEIYNGIKLTAEAEVLASAYDDPQNCLKGGRNCGSGKNEPIVWTARYGTGRVFVLTLGHDLKSVSTPEFQDLLSRGTEWAATGNVLRSFER